MRRAIAKAMVRSALVPQFTIERDVQLGELVDWRAKVIAQGVRVSYSDTLIAATARALRSHPVLNASFADEAIVLHPEINIGFAFDLPEGIVAPAIRRADTMSLSGIAAERERLGECARNTRLGPDELLWTTFTISNLGLLGVRRFRALVVPPQAAILAVGELTGDERMSLALSCDHRVVDGAPAARFLSDVATALESPKWFEELLDQSPD
jgi:pyruvate dehydrogenase E2 component (dihydrolipoamide acetyltransferase)